MATNKQRKRNQPVNRSPIDPSIFDQNRTVLDFETTSLEAAPGRILQAAAITYNPQGEEVSRANWLVRPDDWEDLQKNNVSGITREMYQDDAEGNPLNYTDWQGLQEKLGGYLQQANPGYMVAHNAGFERSWLDELGLAQNKPMLDTVQLFRNVMRPKDAKLDTMRKTFGIESSGRSHTAMVDVEDTGTALNLMTERIQQRKFSTYTEKSRQANPNSAEIAYINRFRNTAPAPIRQAPPPPPPPPAEAMAQFSPLAPQESGIQTIQQLSQKVEEIRSELAQQDVPISRQNVLRNELATFSNRLTFAVRNSAEPAPSLALIKGMPSPKKKSSNAGDKTYQPPIGGNGGGKNPGGNGWGGGGGDNSQPPAPQPSPLPPRRPRVGASTLSAEELQGRFTSGLQGLRRRGHLSSSVSDDTYQMLWSGANGSLGMAEDIAAPYSEGAKQGAYGVHFTNQNFPESQGLFLQVKGGFKTGYDENERALQVLTEGGAEYTIGSLLRTHATGSKREGNLKLSTERLSPEEHLALLVQNAFQAAGNEEYMKGGLQRSTSAVFQDLLTQGNAGRASVSEGMQTPGGALLLSPNDAGVNDAMRRRFASDMAVLVNTSDETYEADVYEELNKQLEAGTAFAGMPTEMRGYRVAKEPQKVQTASGQMIETKNYIGRAVKLAQNIDAATGTGMVARVYPEGKGGGAKYVYGFNKMGLQGGTMEMAEPMGEETINGRRYLRPLPDAPLPQRTTAGQLPPMRVRQTAAYGGAGEEFVQGNLTAGMAFYVNARPGSGSTMLSGQRYRGEDGVGGFYMTNNVIQSLDFVKDLRMLTKTMQVTQDVGGKQVTSERPYFNLLAQGTGEIRGAGQQTPLFDFLKLTAEGGYTPSEAQKYAHENSPFAITGVSLNLPMFMTQSGEAVYGTPNDPEGELLSTESLQQELQQMFADRGQTVDVTRTAREMPNLTFQTRVNTGMSDKGGIGAVKAGVSMGPMQMGVDLDDVDSAYAQAARRRFGNRIPITEVTAESKQMVRSFMAGFQGMPHAQQAELLVRTIQPSSKIFNYIEGLRDDEMTSMTEIAKIYRSEMPANQRPTHRISPEEIFRPLFKTFTDATPEQNVQNLEQFGIGRLAGWVDQGPASEATRYFYETEGRINVASQISDYLATMPDDGPVGEYRASDWLDERGDMNLEYAKQVLPERIYNQVASNPKRLERVAGKVDTLMRTRLRFDEDTNREPGADAVYRMSQYGEGMLMPTTKVPRPEFPGGLRLGYETLFSGVSKYPRSMLELGLATTQGPADANASRSDKAWISMVSSALYNRASQKGYDIPAGNNVVDIDEQMASAMANLVQRDDSRPSLETLSGQIQTLYRERLARQYTEEGETPDMAEARANQFQMGSNSLLRFRGNGVDQYMPSPAAVRDVDWDSVSDESIAHWAVQYQNTTAQLAQATSGAGSAEDAGKAAAAFYGRIERASMGPKSSTQKAIYGRTPHVGFSGRYQAMMGLAQNELYMAPDQASRIARKTGFKSLKSFYSYVDKQYGGKLPGMWFRQPTLGREAGQIASYMVTPKFLRKERGLKTSEIPVGASATGKAFVNPAIATLFSGDYDDDPYGFYLAMNFGKNAEGQPVLGHRDPNGAIIEESFEAIDPDLARELQMDEKQYMGAMNTFVGELFGPNADHYNILKKEAGDIFAGIGGKDPDALFKSAIKSADQAGRAPLEYLTRGVQTKALNDRIKGTSYNVMRALESFFVAGSSNRQGVGQAAQFLSSMLPTDIAEQADVLRENYGRFRQVNRAVSSLAAIYQPGLDLEVPLSQGLSGIESAFGSSMFSLERNGDQEYTNFMFRPSDRTRVVGGEMRKDRFYVPWSSKGTKESLAENTLNTMANWFTSTQNMPNEGLALAFSSNVDQLSTIQEKLKAIPVPGRGASETDQQAYANQRASVLRGMIAKGEINEQATGYRAMLGLAARRAQKKSPEDFKRMQVAYGGELINLPQLMERPEIQAGLSFFNILTGNIPELREQALAASGYAPGENFMADLVRSGFNVQAEGVGFVPELAMTSLADAQTSQISPNWVTLKQRELYSNEATFDIRASGAYGIANPDDAKLQDYAPDAMKGWGNTALYSAIAKKLGIDSEFIYSGSAATKRGTRMERAAFGLAKQGLGDQMGQMFLGATNRPPMELTQQTKIGRARFTGHTDVLGYMPLKDDQGNITGGRLTIGDIKTTNIDRLIEENRANNMTIEDATAAAQQQAYENIAQNPSYRTQVGLYAHMAQGGYLEPVKRAYEAAGGDVKSKEVREATGKLTKMLRERGMDDATAKTVSSTYLKSLQGGATFEVGAGLIPAFTSGQGDKEKLLGVGQDLIGVDWQNEVNPEALGTQGIAAIRGGLERFPEVSRNLPKVSGQEEYEQRTAGEFHLSDKGTGQVNINLGDKIRGSFALDKNAFLPDVAGNIDFWEQAMPLVTAGEDPLQMADVDTFRGFGQRAQQISNRAKPIPAGYTRLTHVTSAAAAQAIQQGGFSYKKSGILGSTTDPYGKPEEVEEFIKTGIPPGMPNFDRRGFGDTVITMDVPNDLVRAANQVATSDSVPEFPDSTIPPQYISGVYPAGWAGGNGQPPTNNQPPAPPPDDPDDPNKKKGGRKVMGVGNAPYVDNAPRAQRAPTGPMQIMVNAIAKIQGRNKTYDESLGIVNKALGTVRGLVTPYSHGEGLAPESNLGMVSRQVATRLFGGMGTGPDPIQNEIDMFRALKPDAIPEAFQQELDLKGGGPEGLKQLLSGLPLGNILRVAEQMPDLQKAREEMSKLAIPDGDPRLQQMDALLNDPAFRNIASLGSTIQGTMDAYGLKERDFRQPKAPGTTATTNIGGKPLSINRQEYAYHIAQGMQNPQVQAALKTLQGVGVDPSKDIETDKLLAGLTGMSASQFSALSQTAIPAGSLSSLAETDDERMMARIGKAMARNEVRPLVNERARQEKIAMGMQGSMKTAAAGIVSHAGSVLDEEFDGKKYGSFQELRQAVINRELDKGAVTKQLKMSPEFSSAMGSARMMELTPQERKALGPEFQSMYALGKGVSGNPSQQNFVNPDQMAKAMTTYATAMSDLDAAEKNLVQTRMKSKVTTEEINRAELDRDKKKIAEAKAKTDIDILQSESKLVGRGLGVTDGKSTVADLAAQAARKGMSEEYEQYMKLKNRRGDLDQQGQTLDTLEKTGKFGDRLNVSKFTRDLFGGFGLSYMKNVLTMGVPALAQGYEENLKFDQGMAQAGMKAYGTGFAPAENPELLAANRRINAGGGAFQQLRRLNAAVSGTAAGDISSAASTGLGAWLAAQWVGGTMGTSVTATGALIGPGAGVAGAALPLAGLAAAGMVGFQQYGKWADLENTQVNLANIGSGDMSNPLVAGNYAWNATGAFIGEAIDKKKSNTGDILRAVLPGAPGTFLGGAVDAVNLNWLAGAEAAIKAPAEIAGVGGAWLNGDQETAQDRMARMTEAERRQVMQFVATNETSGPEELKYLDANLKGAVATRMQAAGLSDGQMLYNLATAEQMGRPVMQTAESMQALRQEGVATPKQTLELANLLSRATEEGFTKAIKGLEPAGKMGRAYELFEGQSDRRQMQTLTQLGDIASGKRYGAFMQAWNIYDQQRDLGMEAERPDLSRYASNLGSFSNAEKFDQLRQNAQAGRQINLYSQIATTTTVNQQAAEGFANWGAQSQNMLMSQQLLARNPFAVAKMALDNGINNPDLFNVDVSRDGQVTGHRLYETSMRLGNISPEENAVRIWGPNWQNSQVATAAVQGVDMTTSGGQTYHLEGQRGIQAMQIDLQAQQARASSAQAMKQWETNWAFTTGVGLGKYNTINPQTGQAFGFNQGPFTVNANGQSFTSQGGGQWGIEDAQRWLQNQQTEWNFGFQERQMGMQRSQFYQNLNLNRRQSVMQRGWQREDWDFQDWQRDTQWQWRTEDFNEEKRFLTGRERRKAEKQMKRETLMHNAEGDQIDKQRNRQEELWKLEDERFVLTRKHFEESFKMQKEQLDKSREFYEEERKLQEESIKFQRAAWVENMNAQKEAIGIQAAIAEKMIQLQKDQLALTMAIENNNAKWTMAASLQSNFLDQIITKVGVAKAVLEDNGASVNTSKSSKKATGLAGGGMLMSDHYVGEFGPEWVRKEAGGGMRVIPAHVTNPRQNTVINSGNSNVGAKPQTVNVTVMIGNRTLGKFVTDTVDNEFRV